MKNEHLARTLQWIIIVFLLFAGPIGWILIYLLWKQWNPAASLKKGAAKAKPAAKRAAAKAKAPAKKKSAKK